MLKDVNIVVLSIQVVRYLGFLRKREKNNILRRKKENYILRRKKSNLQDPYPGPQGNAKLLQPFLRKVGQLKHPNLCLLKDPRVFLVAEVLQKRWFYSDLFYAYFS